MEPTRSKSQQKRVRTQRTAASKAKGKVDLGIWKIFEDSPDPVWGTNGAACFDIKAYLKPQTEVILYDSDNNKTLRHARTELARDDVSGILLNPGDRALIPSGLVLDIPDYHSVRIHPRSGMAWKEGISLTNCEGIIDYDYVEQLYISVINISRKRVFISDGERIAQAELVPGLHADDIQIRDLDMKPAQKTDRAGGFGHTGKK